MEEKSKFFQTAISVNCVVYSFYKNDLKVLLVQRDVDPYKGMLALAGGLIHPDEELDTAAASILKSLTNVENIFRSQIRAFVDKDRHPMGRVVSVAYLCLMRYSEAILTDTKLATDPKWYSIRSRPKLVFDHDKIAERARLHLQTHIRNHPIAFEMLDEKFTLPQLQSLYESVFEINLDKRNFRRKLSLMPFIEDTEEMEKTTAYRPARLYRYNKEKFEEFKRQGGTFSL